MRSVTIPSRKTSLRAAALVASAAMVVVGVQAGSAGAASGSHDSGGLPLALSAGQKASAIEDAQGSASTTAAKIGLGSKEKLVVRDVVKDADGTVHTRYERTYDGLPVLGGDLVVHETRNGARSVTKATDAEISVPTTSPRVAPSAAKKSALGVAADAKNSRTDSQAPRKIVWAAQGKPVLAYETVVKGVQKDGTPSKLHVVTDAATGEKLYQHEAIETGEGTSTYSGKVPLTTTKSGSGYALTDGTRGGHSTYNLAQGTDGQGTLFTNSSDVWGGGAQTAAVDAHYGAAVTWDFYKNVLGRSGIKGDGKGAYSRVHYGDNYVNAFWDDECFCMTYGDGEGNSHPLTALDVAAHEMTHGVTSATAGLEYSGESGGLNEATSDIFGKAVEFYANNKSIPGNYFVGQQININGDGTPLRYMDKPSKDGRSKDYWSSSLGGLDPHFSSGPANHFFYLLSEGSGAKTINGFSYNSPTANNSKITGIGRDKAIKIWYKALTTYFTSTTNYKAARTGTLKAAADLYGSSSTEYKTVAATWTAINVK